MKHPDFISDRVSVDPRVINKRVLGLTGPDVEHTGRQLPLQSEELSASAVKTDRNTVVPGMFPILCTCNGESCNEEEGCGDG